VGRDAGADLGRARLQLEGLELVGPVERDDPADDREALIVAAVFYWMMTLILTFFQSRIEARLARGDR